jgi:hypothetical protein
MTEDNFQELTNILSLPFHTDSIWGPPCHLLKAILFPRGKASNRVNLAFRISSNAEVLKPSEFLAANPEVPGSIPGAIRFSE